MINENLGTYRTSYEVMQTILEFGGISYIAHANTSSMFTDEKFLPSEILINVLDDLNSN